MAAPGMPGQEFIVDGYAYGYDDGSTGAEVAHKAMWGFVRVVNVTVSANAFIAGATLEIRDGTGVAIWGLTVPALGAAAGPGLAFPVILDCIFGTDIRTFITAAAGTMTVAYK